MARTTQIRRARRKAKNAPKIYNPHAATMSEKPRQYRYPGVNIDLRHLNQEEGRLGFDYYRLGSFEGLDDYQTPLLYVREVAMTLLMDRLTDKPNWHEKVFNEEIVAKWRQEALTAPEDEIWNSIVRDEILRSAEEERQTIAELPPDELADFDFSSFSRPRKPERSRIISEKAFDYCIAELRCKAADFKNTGLIFTLNSNENTAIKSDSVVTDELHQSLRVAFDKLVAEQGSNPDWHPRSQDMVQDLVHPSMHPFVYGKSLFLQDEVVGVEDAIEQWAGKGQVVEKPLTRPLPPRDPWGADHWVEDFWSEKYQWLPANLAFQEDGTVKFTSYVNNLHPKKHSEIYRTIERLIDTAIPAWERVLTGRAVIAGDESEDEDTATEQKRFELPPEVYDQEDTHVYEPVQPDLIKEWEEKNGKPVPVDDYEWDEVDELTALSDWHSDPEEYEGLTLEQLKEKLKLNLKWKYLRDVILPDPTEFQPVKYVVGDKLGERFKYTGLQVIVKMATIELTPEKPDFPVGSWHIEGMMNEHIVATALYYVDSENVTPSSLEFRMETHGNQDELQELVGQDCYGPYEAMYGCRFGHGSETLQKLGSVETRQGRLLAFPNVFHHRVSPFSLQDRTKPGHRRFIALWLVDPHQRIVSTANVPPQQLGWWAEAVFGGKDRVAKGDMPSEVFQLLLEQGLADTISPPKDVLDKMSNRLPTEIMEMVRKERVIPEGLMTDEEAKEHRLKLMEERSRQHEKAETEWNRGGYNFCEH
ncbi:hypothetical protein QBC40DRAFT_284400 [Triangularia verruculosa]|uniref:Uncharacterized protein n=1 Tax=Triangularia verruculosa TaxID=2587418 RepID=A0AAN6XDB3_9PEZI|nr:hypothetical protein QBC40DRAFT_284400 [Triangularia verruculosa]